MIKKINTSGNRVTVHADYLNIIMALELNEILITFNEKGRQTIILDLGKVERLSTLGLLIVIRAAKSFKRLKMKGLQPSVAEALTVMQAQL